MGGKEGTGRGVELVGQKRVLRNSPETPEAFGLGRLTCISHYNRQILCTSRLQQGTEFASVNEEFVSSHELCLRELLSATHSRCMQSGLSGLWSVGFVVVFGFRVVAVWSFRAQGAWGSGGLGSRVVRA